MQAGILRYYNLKYGFTLRLPRWWKPYIKIRGEREKGVGRYSGEYVLHLSFRYKGITYGDVLTILVYKMPEAQWKKVFDDSPLIYLANHGGRVFACMLPEELPYKFVDPKTGEYDMERYRTPIRYMKRMVNKEALAAAKTISFACPPPPKKKPAATRKKKKAARNKKASGVKIKKNVRIRSKETFRAKRWFGWF